MKFVPLLGRCKPGDSYLADHLEAAGINRDPDRGLPVTQGLEPQARSLLERFGLHR